MGRRVAGIVLAAGAGSRFGGGKVLANLAGRPILQHVLDRLAAAGLDDVIVVLGGDADAIEASIDWRAEGRVRNPDPSRGLSSSLRIGVSALPEAVDGALIVLADQPLLSVDAVRALLAAPPDAGQPVAVPVYRDDRGRNPVLLERTAFRLVDETAADRGLGPVLAAHPELVREVAVPGVVDNPDVDTRADLVALLETVWAARVSENREQVDRHREVPDAADFYAPVRAHFRADPTRTDEPALAVLLGHVRPGETWLDIGAGAGRYALPIARALAPSGGRVIALDHSPGMLESLRDVAAEYGIGNVEAVDSPWPPAGDLARFAADVTLIAHVGYDIEAIGPFVRSMEACARRLCIAVLMERQPASIADACWPPVWGEDRVALPALADFVELLEAMGRAPSVERLVREPHRFETREDLADFLRRQLWVKPGSAADARFLAALEPLLVVDAEGRVGLRGQRPLPIGVVRWDPTTTAR